MRAFLAIELAPESRQSVAAIERRWKASLPSARWVRVENLHLTLRFLGDIDPAVVAPISGTLRRVAGRVAPFTCSLHGAGCFPNPKRARVLWVGVQPVPDALDELSRAVEEAVRGHGFAPEEREFQPHLTIARFKTPDRGVADVVAALEGHDLGDTDVSELVLFESRLSPQGASYRALERFRLGGPAVEQLV